MRLAEAYAGVDLSKIKEALIGGRLIVYSTGCPHSADHAIAHGAELASFAFASPTFGPDAEDGTLAPLFSDNPVIAKAVGTPGSAHARGADGVPGERKYSPVIFPLLQRKGPTAQSRLRDRAQRARKSQYLFSRRI